jgi:hypothetical protein
MIVDRVPIELTASQMLYARCGSCECLLNWRHHCALPKRFYSHCCDLIYYAYQPENRAVIFTVTAKQVDLRNVISIGMGCSVHKDGPSPISA